LFLLPFLDLGWFCSIPSLWKISIS
jgi:hypothetical protein